MSHSWNLWVDINKMFWPDLWPMVVMINQGICCSSAFMTYMQAVVTLKQKYSLMRCPIFAQSQVAKCFLALLMLPVCFPPLSLTLCSKPLWWLTLLSSNGSHVDSIQLRSRLKSSQPLEYQFFQLSPPNNRHRATNFPCSKKSSDKNRDNL